MDTRVRDKIIVLVDSWKETFGGHGAPYPQYYMAYSQLQVWITNLFWLDVCSVARSWHRGHLFVAATLGVSWVLWDYTRSCGPSQWSSLTKCLWQVLDNVIFLAVAEASSFCIFAEFRCTIPSAQGRAQSAYPHSTSITVHCFSLPVSFFRVAAFRDGYPKIWGQHPYSNYEVWIIYSAPNQSASIDQQGARWFVL